MTARLLVCAQPLISDTIQEIGTSNTSVPGIETNLVINLKPSPA
jgi:hypothetical protein